MRVSVSLPPLRLVVSRLQQAEVHLVILFLLPGGSLLVPAWMAVRRYRSRRYPLAPGGQDPTGAPAFQVYKLWSVSRAALSPDSRPASRADVARIQPTSKD